MNDWRDKMEQYYPDWYDGPPDPHVSLIHLRNNNGEFIDRWQCVDCNKEGTFDEMSMEAGCTYQHKPCKYCGCAPVCAKDCSGIGKILNDPRVYVAGFDPSREH